MKRIITNTLFMLFIFVFIVSEDVSAYSEENYINSENVEIKYDLYKELCNIYSEGYIEFITQDKFDLIKDNNLSDIDVTEVSDFPLISTLSSSHTTTYKRLKIIKNGMLITLQLTWLNIPTVRSYDVMGIRFDGPSLSGTPAFNQTYKIDGIAKKETTHYLQNFSNGFGTSFLLPSGNVTNLVQSLDFLYSGTGKVYGSYQHAQKNITLANSKKYTISAYGYGNVLDFDSSVKDSYDAMGGVDLSV